MDQLSRALQLLEDYDRESVSAEQEAVVVSKVKSRPSNEIHLPTPAVWPHFTEDKVNDSLYPHNHSYPPSLQSNSIHEYEYDDDHVPSYAMPLRVGRSEQQFQVIFDFTCVDKCGAILSITCTLSINVCMYIIYNLYI